MKNAFTMIELIFVIVIIGILAAVAIPKLTATRDDAEATICAHEAGQILNEVAAQYAKLGNATFKSTKISTMTNVRIHSSGESRGIKTDTTVDSTGITYVCENQDIFTLLGADSGPVYTLTATVTAGSTPASKTASNDIIKNVLSGSSPKTFEL